MPNILTAAEAANFVRTDATDAVLLQYLPLVDVFIQNASGHDWTADSPIHPTAKIAAGMVIACWYDNPNALGTGPAALTGQLVQLEAIALRWRKYEFKGRSGAGGLALPGARVGDVVIKLIGTYGVSGSQIANFESVVSVDDQLLQSSGSDLSANLYVVVLKHPAEEVSA